MAHFFDTCENKYRDPERRESQPFKWVDNSRGEHLGAINVDIKELVNVYGLV